MTTKTRSPKESQPELLVAFKCTRPNGTDFRTGTIDYAAAMASSEPITIDAEPSTGIVCGRGLHVSPTAQQTIQFADRDHRPWRWFEVRVNPADVVEADTQKSRVRRLTVHAEIALADIFGPDIAARIEAVKVETQTWKEIPWFKPAKKVSDATMNDLFTAWHSAISPWLLKGHTLPTEIRFVRERGAAAAAVAVAADAADAVAVAVAVATDAAADAAADAVAVAVAAADAAADAVAVAVAVAAATAADAADAADAVVAAAATAADAADAADADSGDAAKILLPYCWRWYVRPRSVLYRSARWQLAGMSQPNPWKPIVEMYRLGCMPIGFSGGQFVIYTPTPSLRVAGKRSAAR